MIITQAISSEKLKLPESLMKLEILLEFLQRGHPPPPPPFPFKALVQSSPEHT